MMETQGGDTCKSLCRELLASPQRIMREEKGPEDEVEMLLNGSPGSAPEHRTCLNQHSLNLSVATNHSPFISRRWKETIWGSVDPNSTSYVPPLGVEEAD